MDLLIIKTHGIHLFLETIKGCVILMYELLNIMILETGWWKITFYIVPDIKSDVRISVGTFVVA